MFGWWRRLMEMPDRTRARRLALALGACIVILLYALGGLSLYARAHLLGDEHSLLPGGAPSAAETSAPTLRPSPTTASTEAPTPFPTLTPRPGLVTIVVPAWLVLTHGGLARAST